MLLVMDVGNTTTVVGIFDGKKLTAHWRLSSILHTSDELGVYYRQVQIVHYLSLLSKCRLIGIIKFPLIYWF